MKVVLFNYKTGMYVKLNGDNSITMTSSKGKARQFSLTSALNFRSKNLNSLELRNQFPGLSSDDFDVVSATSDQLMDMAPSRSRKMPKPELEFKRVDVSEVSLEDAYAKVRALQQQIPELAGLFDNMDLVRTCLKKEQCRTENAILDIQHKAEFDNLGAADGYKLYKLLQQERRERRLAKDALQILDHVDDALPILVQKLATGINEVEQNQQGRFYRPRELPELFDA